VVVASSGIVGVELAPALEETTLVIAGPVGAVVGTTPVSEGAGVLPAATELGRLEVEVKVTVDTVLDVVTKVDDPSVTVAVTGQVVSVT
jgi:ABC-type sugar transport system substrate-binding protein